MVATEPVLRSGPPAGEEIADRYEAAAQEPVLRVITYDLHSLGSEGSSRQRADISIEIGLPPLRHQLYSGEGRDAIEAFDRALVNALRRIWRLLDLESQLAGYSHSVCMTPGVDNLSCIVKLISRSGQTETGSGEQLNAIIISTLWALYSHYLGNRRLKLIVE